MFNQFKTDIENERLLSDSWMTRKRLETVMEDHEEMMEEYQLDSKMDNKIFHSDIQYENKRTSKELNSHKISCEKSNKSKYLKDLNKSYMSIFGNKKKSWESTILKTEKRRKQKRDISTPKIK